jgi:tetratricopeptide (TPR) repeat protein
MIWKLCDVVEGRASWDDKVYAYTVAHDLTTSMFAFLGADLDTTLLRARSARLLAGSINEDQRHGSYSMLFREAAELMLDRGGLSWLDMDCETLAEFSLALSEHKEDMIDAGSDARWEIAIYSALSSLAISEQVFRCFPDDPMVIIEMAWDTYYSSKRERQRFDESIVFSRAVLEMMYERFKEGSVSAEEFTQSVRVFAWSVIMKAVWLVNSGQLDLAREILERDRVIDYLHMAEPYERDVRWRRDLLYAINGYYQLMGRILDRDRVYRASKLYPDCPLLSTLDQPGQDSPLAIEYLDRSISYLREIAPYEDRRWMVTRAEGKALAYKGDFSSAVRILERGLREVPTDKPNQVVSMEEGLIAALKGEICYGGVPPEKRGEDALRVLELVWQVARQKQYDAPFIEHELFPALLGVEAFLVQSRIGDGMSEQRIKRVLDEIEGYMGHRETPLSLKDKWGQIRQRLMF